MARDLPSLQHLATLRVAIAICEAEDTQYLIARFQKTNGKGPAGLLEGQWKSIRGKADRKLTSIGVPRSLVDSILAQVWPISYEVLKWILHHFWDMGTNILTEHQWTQHGAIEYEKTAGMVVESETLEIAKRFKMACLYCMESQVRSLWDTMNLADQRSFYVRGNLKRNSGQNLIVLFWTYYIQEVPVDHWQSPALNHTEVFKYAAENGYLTATKYFIGKLRRQSKYLSARNCVRTIVEKFRSPQTIIAKDHFAVAYFLLNEVHPSDKSFYFMYGPVLYHFLEWPLQKYFMAIVSGSMGYFLSEKGFYELLLRIFAKEKGGFKDYDYKNLFMEFWLKSPEYCKKYVNTHTDAGIYIFFKFVKLHFCFVFDERSYQRKAKFRAILFQNETSEKVNYFEEEYVEFFKFLVRERVVTKQSVQTYVDNNIPFHFLCEGASNIDRTVSLGELLYLMDGILGGM